MYSVPIPAASGQCALRCYSRADRAAHAGAAEAAITLRILGEVLLMIVLGKIERRRVDDLGSDRAHALRVERLGIGRLRGFRGGALRRRKYIDAGAVLGADVVALAHALGRVVALPEGLEQLLVGDFLRVVDH